jgi:SAM-dependent methyltransferase
MAHQDGRLPSYWAERARRYDEESTYDKGDREQQVQILSDFLSFVATPNLEFCDLGCGTGFFTKTFLDLRDDTRGLAVDASPEMLAIARAKLERYGKRIAFCCSKFDDIRWQEMTHKFDVVFSCLAIHHLDDAAKWRLFHSIYASIRPGGYFILFDLFRLSSTADNQILEYLACRDIQRRLMTYLQVSWEAADLAIERLIDNDRRMRSLEGDKEAILADTISALRDARFVSVIQLFQEARIAGLCCTTV